MRQRSILGFALSLVVATLLTSVAAAQDSPGMDGPVIAEVTVSQGDDGTTMLESSDPRASGAVTIGSGDNVIATDEGRALLASFALRLVNDEGTWTGTGRAYGDGEEQDVMVWELSGEDTYDGLSLFVVISAASDGSWGIIVPSDAVPAFPEQPAE
jgi:hypothetical protein